MADVVFAPLPLGGGDGGKNPLAMIGMIIVAIIAAIATWYIGGAGGWAVATLGVTEGVANAIAAGVGIAISIVGNLLVNALFPTNPMPAGQFNTQQLEAASPTYSTTVSQNRARLYQTIPETFGTHDIVPDLAAQYWTEFQGNQQYVHALL
jgi:hypothetical protein